MSKFSKIRFKGYDISLERKTIGDITTSFSGGTPKSSNKSYYEGNIPFIRSGEVKSKQTELFISDEALNNSSAKLVEKGDILYALYGATSGEVAISQINGAINQAILAIKPNQGYSSEFIMNYLKKEKDNILEKYLQGGQGNLSAAIVKSIELSLPSQDEQSTIGSLFRTLDNLLASYKDNLSNYQSLKATMLSKMFPKAGQTVPEIRLDGFEGEWENAIINDYVTLLNGRAFKQDELLNEGKYRVVRVGNFNTNEKWYYSNLELEENKYANKDDLLYLWATNFGPEIWKEEKIIFHYHIWKLDFDRSIIDRNYLYYWLEKDKKRIQQNTNGSTMVHVTKSMMENREFLFPMFREQQAIGAYFSNLDNLINSHQEKISQLETLKKKLLQDMFI
ncbi:restriction endonuclease subunit S [Streptococcus parasanguinis]|uniref:restriction endonuclease subunit S n=1 Tax=Streptococcus parasanguinis TaxID=1318 RepID=UPI001BEB7253|nr:restriction endonuclease subunit S [Streptococcus parasanguinis]MBT3138051.1 restriction endonuclease subunit S [Streptococcus parasanguinis]